MNCNLTKSELEVMHVLWAAGKPLSRAGILEHSSDKTWKDSSVHILLNGLLDKEYIQEAGFARSGKTFGRLFAPCIPVEEYYASVFESIPAECRARVLACLSGPEHIV